MKCSLCEKPIDKYNPDFHHLIIDENHAVDVCPECVDKFRQWQSKVISVLFPTKALKKRYGGAKEK